MKSVTVIVLETIEKTRQRFLDQYQGLQPSNEKRLFVNWYVESHKETPLRILISDLSDYYLHISEDRIIRYLNEQEPETATETP